MAEQSAFSKLFGKTKELTKSAYDKAKPHVKEAYEIHKQAGKEIYHRGKEASKKAYEKSKQAVKDKIHDTKKNIAFEVLEETRALTDDKKESQIVKEADNLVSRYYAEGGVIGILNKKFTFKELFS